MEKVLKTRRKIKPIARKRHNYVYLLISILFLIATIYIVFNTSPNGNLMIKNFGIPSIPLFLISLFILLYFFFTFLLIKKIQGLLISGFNTFYVILRIIGLTHWLFLILFIALFITLELFLLKKK